MTILFSGSGRKPRGVPRNGNNPVPPGRDQRGNPRPPDNTPEPRTRPGAESPRPRPRPKKVANTPQTPTVRRLPNQGTGRRPKMLPKKVNPTT